MTTIAPPKAELWHQRRQRLYIERLKAAGRVNLASQLFALPHSEETANYLVEASPDLCIKLTAYLVEFPEESNRLLYLDPAEQRSELDRLTTLLIRR
jgi:hypothetical protein